MTTPQLDETGACPACGAGPGDDWDGKDISCIHCDKWEGKR